MDISEAISNAFKTLLNTKHLYQSVELKLPQDGEKGNLEAKREGQLNRQAKAHWWPNLTMAGQGPSGWTEFSLPTVHAGCHVCKTAHPQPFNPTDQSCVHGNLCDVQRFTLFYECQSCKGTPIGFFVRRNGLKLTLVGRDPIERVVVAEYIPQEIAGYFSNAVIAYNAGRTLAGILYLRILIEQFWRSRPEVKPVLAAKAKPTGEEMGNAYNKELTPDFQIKFPSLLSSYDRLSAAIHTASEDNDLFERETANILKHFDARRVHELK